MASAPGTDSYRPSYRAEVGAPAAPPDVQKAMYEFQGNNCPPRGGGFTFRQNPRPRISDRPLLTELRTSSPDLLFSAEGKGEKFRHIDELTDSEEEDMDVSGSGGDEIQPPSKRLRSGPSWSNPDPYTALPPPAETQKKKRDVVKLIRRSRLTPPAALSTSAVAVNGEDFISLDMGDRTLENSIKDRYEPPASAPTGPKSQPPEIPTQRGKRKRDQVDDVGKLPPRANRGARLHQGGKVLREWTASDVDSSTPWYQTPSTPDLLAGVA